MTEGWERTTTGWKRTRPPSAEDFLLRLADTFERGAGHRLGVPLVEARDAAVAVAAKQELLKEIFLDAADRYFESGQDVTVAADSWLAQATRAARDKYKAPT